MRGKRAWLLYGAFIGGTVCLASCKTPPPTEEAPPFVPKELVDAGSEPRLPLRYDIADGTTTRSKVAWTITSSTEARPGATISGLKTMTLEGVVGPAERKGNEVHYPFEVVSSKAVAGPGASNRLRKALRQDAEFLTGVGAKQSMTDRGAMTGGRYNAKAADVPLRLLWTIDNLFTLLSLPLLPDEEIGVGGVWKVRGMLGLHGLRMVQEATYTVVARDGDTVTLELQFERNGERKVMGADADESVVGVESARLRANGNITLDLRTLGANGTVAGVAKSRIIVDEDGEKKRVDVDETFEAQLQSWTKLP